MTGEKGGAVYKIGIMGTFGVGKTTFVHRLLSELNYRAFQMEMVPELFRLCPYDINESGAVSIDDDRVRSMEYPMK
jgi:GTPase SAR1 family protein